MQPIIAEGFAHRGRCWQRLNSQETIIQMLNEEEAVLKMLDVLLITWALLSDSKMFQTLTGLGFLLLLLCLLFQATADRTIVDEQLEERWQSASTSFDDIVFSHRPKTIEVLGKSIAESQRLNLTSQCVDSLVALKSGLEERKFWSYKCKFESCARSA